MARLRDFGPILGLFYFFILIWVIFTGINKAKFVDLNNCQIRDDIILAGVLNNANSVGQTFVAKKPYLNSIRLFMNSYQGEQHIGGKYSVFVQLLDIHSAEIASESFPIAVTSGSMNLDFSFPPQPDSLNKNYYLLIRTDAPPSRLSTWTSLYDSYPYGDIYLNGEPSQYDLTFCVYHKPPILYWINDTLINSGARFIDLFAISFIFLCLGYLVYNLLGPLSENFIETMIYSIGIGIATPPVLFLAMSLMGINIDRINIFIMFLILVGLTTFKNHLSLRTRIGPPRLPPNIDCTEIAVLVIMFLLAAFTRVSQISDLVVPNWVDGIVHQRFLTKILERQAMLFDAIYPKGFHANVIFIHFLFGRTLHESTLLMGQWFSLMSGFTFYLLARRFLGASYGLFSLGIYWFLAAFPAYMIVWGRYPYLQGLVLLPPAMIVYWDHSLQLQSRQATLTLLMLGLGLTYYGSFMIFGAFIITDVVCQISRDGYAVVLRRNKGIALAMLPIVLILVIRLGRAFDMNIFGQDSSITAVEDSMRAFEISFTHGGWFTWISGVLGILLAYKLESQRILFLAKWGLTLSLIAFLQWWLGITISSMANMVIFMSIPLALLAGFAFKYFFLDSHRAVGWLKHASLALITISGAYNIGGIVQPSTVLYSRADQNAVKWIGQNTSKDSVFLINSFLWGDDYAPSDGGGWIPFLADRGSLLFDANDLKDLLESEQIEYVYIGDGYGDIDLQKIMNDPRFSSVFDKDGVRIFKYSSTEAKTVP